MTIALPKRNLFQHMFRGLTTLEHVGPHPGIRAVAVLTLMTMLGVASKGTVAIIGGIAVSMLIYVPMLLVGAVDRSKTNDRIDKRQQERMLQFLEKEF